MINFDLFPPGALGDQHLSKPQFELSEFGRAEYSDPVVPVNMLMVMMGFTLVLPTYIVDPNADLYFILPAIICGSIYLLFYMFYLTEYYEKLWEPYYLLPVDKLFFRIYCIFIGLVVITLMPKWPEHWMLYMLALFFVMYLKKRSTRNRFRTAVNFEHKNYSLAPLKIKAQYVLVETFTLNFLILGVVPLVPVSIASSVFYVCSKYPQYLSFYNGFFGFNETELSMYQNYVALSVFVALATSLFWAFKIRSGLIEMKNQIEAGHYDYFEERDIRNRFRRGRNVNR